MFRKQSIPVEASIDPAALLMQTATPPWARLQDLAGITRELTIHDLRRTDAPKAVQEAPITVISELLVLS
ncbi:MAG: hypothetical protein AAF725_02600 [Acidobacteriota bacterium]